MWPKTPLVYFLPGRRFCSLDIKLYYVASMHFMDLAYLERHTLYNMLYTAATEKPMLTKEDRYECFCTVRNLCKQIPINLW